MSLAEKMDMPPESVPAGSGGMLEGRFRIDLSRPVDFLQGGVNMAVQAADMQDPSQERFAVVSTPYSSYRRQIAQLMMESRIPGMIDLLARGTVRFSETDVRYVSVFDLPRGGRLFTDSEGAIAENLVLDYVLPPVSAALLTLHRAGLTHRAIRADNLFFADAERSQVIVGEAITTAPGSLQPDVYEPQESASAHPYGRGDGTPADDIYAVGILMLHLLTGRLPGADMSADEIYRGKLGQGTFALLAEDLDLSSRISDVLAGLLHDDPKRRWNVETLINWRDAIKESPRRGRGDRRAFSKILFDGEEYNSPRLLAHEMTKRPKSAVELLQSGRLEKWVRNSLRDEDASKEISHIQSSSAGAPRGQKRNGTTAVTQATRLLDPDGPLWYRNVSFTRGAIGNLMLQAYQLDDTEMKKSIAELFESGLLLTMAVSEIRENKEKRAEWMSESAISNCFDYMKRSRDLGYGLERCLYELNPVTPCLSPLVLGSHVKNVPDFLTIAEKKLVSANGQGNPFDRHAAAFIASKSKGLDKYLKTLSYHAPGSVPHTLVQLKLFAKLQAVAHPAPLPGFAAWAEEMLKPVFAKIRSRLRREVISQRFKEAKKSGNLETILTATDIERQIAADSREYENALATATQADQMAAFLANGTEHRRAAANHYGAWITSVLSVTSLITSMVLSALYFMG
ncbi:hypothetical protein GQF03_07235 [Sneathiella chungangensis]|uniref:Protein kinase domain-containing protein n=1 Tax=Sneathiella chungangensis TaxID=1418234 RepID=A0A845ME16_9PROT|nr:hypothetical protein [Sneathiella chungangensis]MZR22119.1 hypothetical protein [Sneathiella chungangensis]